MNIILYTIDCPCCRCQEEKLRQADIPFTTNSDTLFMLAEGITTLPVLEVDGNRMKYAAALKWLKGREYSHEN